MIPAHKEQKNKINKNGKKLTITQIVGNFEKNNKINCIITAP